MLGTSLTLSICFPIDDLGRTRPVAAGSDDSDSNCWERSSSVEAEVDYVRIYQPIKSSPLAKEAIWECAAARNDAIFGSFGRYVRLREGDDYD